jgi:hypothetical protein
MKHINQLPLTKETGMVFLGLVIPNVVKFKTVMVIESGQEVAQTDRQDTETVDVNGV